MGEDTEGMVESTSKLRALVKGMTGFDIMEDEDTFKAIDEIIIGIGEHYKELSDIDQAALLEALAGKRAGNALAAALNNVDMIKDALKTAEESEGSALKEQENYEKSIQYSIDRLKATAQDLATDFIKSDWIKTAVDGLTHILELLDSILEKTGSIIPILTTIGGIFGAYKINKIGGNIIGNLSGNSNSGGLLSALFGIDKNKIKEFLGKEITIGAKEAAKEGGEVLGSTLTKVASEAIEVDEMFDVMSAAQGAATYSEAMGEVTLATEGVTAATGAATISMSTLLGIFAIAGVALYGAYKIWDHFNVTVAEVDENINEINGKISTLKSKLEELESLDNRTSATETRIKLLKKEIKLEERALELEQKRRRIELLGTGFTDLFDEDSFRTRLWNIEGRNDNANGPSTVITDQTLINDNLKILKQYEEGIESVQEEVDKIESRTDIDLEEKDQLIKELNYNYTIEEHNNKIEETENLLDDLESRAIKAKQLVLDYEDLGVTDKDHNEDYEQAKKDYNDWMKFVIDGRKKIGKYDPFKTEIIDGEGNHTFIEDLPIYDDINNLIEEEKDAPEIITEMMEKYKDLIPILNQNGVSITDIIKDFGGLNDIENEVNKSTSKLQLSVEEIFYKADSTPDFEDDIKGLKQYYTEELQKANDLGVDFTQKVFGNINLDDDRIIEWNQANINKFKDALESWGDEAESYLGSYSTVDAMSGEYQGIEFAFTPMLKTANGMEYLDADTVDNYINSLIDEASKDGSWTNEELFTLDAQGLEINGKKIQGLIADIGDTAEKTAESMHFIGKDGSIEHTNKEIEELTKKSSKLKKIKADLIGLAQSGKLDETTLQKYEYFDELLKLLGKDANISEDEIKGLVNSINEMSVDNSVDDLKGFGDAIDVLGEAYKAFSKGERIDVDQLSAIQDKFGATTEAYQAFEQAVLSGETDLQTAFNNLVTDYARQENMLGNLTEENKKYYIAQLESKGVTNAQAVVEKYLANAEEYRKNVQNDLLKCNTSLDESQGNLYISSEKLENATTEEIVALITEAEKSGIAAESLAIFALKKQLAAGININNPSEIDYLVKLAESAGIASSSVVNLAKAKEILAKVEANNAVISAKNKLGIKVETVDTAEARADVEKYIKEIEEAVNNFDPVTQDINIDYDWTKSQAGLEDAAKGASDTTEKLDWLAKAIERVQRNITNLGKTVSATYKDWSTRNGAIKDEIAEIGKEIQLQQYAYEYYMKKANEVVLDKKYKDLVMNGGIDIEPISDETTKKAIQEFQELYEKALAASDAVEDLHANIASLAKEKFNNVKSEFEGLISEITHFSNMVDKEQSHVENMGKIAGKSFYQAQISYNNQQLEQLQAERSALESKLSEAMSEGGIQEGSADYNEMRDAIYSVDEAIADCTYETEELQKKMKEVAKLNFDDLKSQFENVVNIIKDAVDTTDSIISMTNNAGYIASEQYYQNKINASKAQVTTLRSEYERLNQELKTAMASGDIEQFSPEWYEMQESISSVKNELIDAANSTIEFTNALRQIQWDMFDRGVDSIQKLVDETEFFRELLSYEDLFDDNGAWTNAGMSTRGLMVEEYQAYMDAANAYGKEAADIKKLLETDPKNTTLIDRYYELIEAQRQAILNSKKEKKAIEDLYKEYQDNLLDVIKKLVEQYKNALNAQKDYTKYSPLYYYIQCIPLNCWEALKIFNYNIRMKYA